MASDNKNTSKLARSEADEDTSGLKVLSVDLIPTDEELEMDADTFALEDRESDTDTAATLRSDLRSRDERIASLQYDIEQLRSRWSGLEKEIEAREELTHMLQSELRAAHKSIAAQSREIEALRRELDANETARQEPERQVPGTDADELDALRRQAELDARRIEMLETQLGEALDAADTSGEAATGSTDAAGAPELQRKYASRGDELARQRRILERTEADLREAAGERGRLEAMLKVARSENTELRANLEAARREISDYRSFEQPENARLITEQRGALADNAERIARLETRLEQSEAYGDELRRKLADANRIYEDARLHAENLEASLASVKSRANGFEREVAEARSQLVELKEASGADRQRFEDEIAKLRMDLGDAQETIAAQDTINSTLASELIEDGSTRQDFARKLAKLNGEHATEVEDLRRRARALETALEEAEQKIGNKDNAITALLNELASKSKSIESIDEIESVIQEIDGRMSERIEANGQAEKEKPTRVLTGRIDGQELRFPLFKDRLTIGRTAQNDIQLRAQYVSRRHAVVLVDEHGAKIVDWGSKNGIYVNKARISEHALSNGDTVTIGAAEFVYEERPRRDIV